MHLLWVASIGEIPDNEVTRRDPLLLGEPRPQVVIGFAFAVMELNCRVAELHGRKFVDDICGVESVIGDEIAESWGTIGGTQIVHDAVEVATNATELASVNRNVPVIGVAIAIKAALHVLVANDAWCIVAECSCICAKGHTAAHMVGMAVRVHQSIKRIIRPLANGVNYLLSCVHMAGVETHNAVAGVPGDDMAERLHHCETIGNL